MNTVRGTILVKETNRPLPNVLVVAYDYDGQRLPQPQGDVLSHALSPVRPNPQLAGFWASLQSDRLGSVLTDAKGNFELTFEDDLFRVRGGNEARPDLLFFVMAPEDAAPPGQVTPPVESRILHISSAIRVGAGRIESCLFRIPQAVVDAHDMPGAATDRPPLARASMVHSTLKEKLRFSAEVAPDDEIRALMAPRQLQAKVTAKTGRSLLDRLIRDRTSIPTALIATTPAQRVELQRSNIDLRLNKLVGKGPFELRLPANVDTEAGPTPEEITQARSEHLDRVRLRSIAQTCEARRLCREIRARAEERDDPEPTPGTDGDAGGGSTSDAPPPPVTAETAQQAILERIAGQIAPLATYESGQRADTSNLDALLAGLELKGGPADADAYHDFHTLHIAFKSVWAAVYDDGLKLNGAALYDDWVAVRKYLGDGEPSEEELGEFRSMRDFIHTVERDLSAAAGLANRTGTLPDFDGNPRGFLDFLRDHGVPIPEEIDGMVSQIEADTAEALGGGRPARAAGGVVRAAASRGSVRVRSRDSRSGSISARGPEGNDVEFGFPPPPDENLLERLGRLMTGLAGRLREPYAFDVFAPNSFNFGLMVTYRQRWRPEAYQVGGLVSTMPLAPGEKRTFSVKQTRKVSRSEKEVKNNLRSHSGESSNTSRADAEIVQKAASTTNFKQTAHGSFSLGEFLDVGTTSEFSNEQRTESESRKKSFREAVRKAAEEYKQERTLEVTSATEDTSESVTTGEIANPNNEISVTYLFYELQRRYQITERLHRVRPVVMVAQDVPKPEDIDEDWLLTHAWILRRVLLDDSLQDALRYVSDTMAGDEFAVEVQQATWKQSLSVVNKIAAQFDARADLRDKVRTRVVELLDKTQRDDTGHDVAAAIFSGGLSLLMGGGEEDSLAAAREAADRELEMTDAEYAETEARFRQAMSALEASTERYVSALRAQMNRRTAIDQLRVHIKENILHYMQAIWSHEPPDQRFFRLYNLPIDWVSLEEGSRPTHVTPETDPEPSTAPTLGADVIARILARGALDGTKFRFDPSFVRSEPRELVEVANLDEPLGFKGNYMIFPLKETNPLIEYMLQFYPEDDVLGVRDPDDYGNYDVEELEDLIACVSDDPEVSEDDRSTLLDLLCDRLAHARQDFERVIVPTGQLFIEALPGKHPVLEDFKLAHRSVDLLQADAEVRRLNLENLRAASRLISGDRSDPDIDKHILVEGPGGVDVTVE